MSTLATLANLSSPPLDRVSCPMDERDDETLLKEIAKRHDREAFGLLFSRHQKRAYNTALYLTGNPNAAEDAVQEAMLDVWLRASSFQPQRGSARGWLLSLVTNKSIDRVRQKRKDQNQAKRTEAVQACAPRDLSPAERTEHGELLAALRQTLELLPLNDRRLVTLYYGAGLTYQEIARDASMPMQTVAFRIQKVLETLRVKLAQAGFAAAAPLLTVEHVGEAICSGARSAARTA